MRLDGFCMVLTSARVGFADGENECCVGVDGSLCCSISVCVVHMDDRAKGRDWLVCTIR